MQRYYKRLLQNFDALQQPYTKAKSVQVYPLLYSPVKAKIPYPECNLVCCWIHPNSEEVNLLRREVCCPDEVLLPFPQRRSITDLMAQISLILLVFHQHDKTVLRFCFQI